MEHQKGPEAHQPPRGGVFSVWREYFRRGTSEIPGAEFIVIDLNTEDLSASISIPEVLGSAIQHNEQFGIAFLKKNELELSDGDTIGRELELHSFLHFQPKVGFDTVLVNPRPDAPNEAHTLSTASPRIAQRLQATYNSQASHADFLLFVLTDDSGQSLLDADPLMNSLLEPYYAHARVAGHDFLFEPRQQRLYGLRQALSRIARRRRPEKWGN